MASFGKHNNIIMFVSGSRGRNLARQCAILWLVSALITYRCECSAGASASGPGLAPERIVLPARYFYVDLTSEKPHGYALEKAQHLRVEIGGSAAAGSGAPCRLWFNKLDRRDGTFIVRYKLYETCQDLYIHVFYKDKHVDGSPFISKGPVQAEHCNCPAGSLEDWLKEYGCPQSYPQITGDLAPFTSLDMRAITPRILQDYHRPRSVSFCHYVIKDNQISRKCYGDHVGFNMFSDNILLFLARRTHLPDTEFFMNLGDWPLIKRGGEALPMWSWCGSNETLDIVLPTYDITESTLENMGRVMLDMLSVQGGAELPWERREPRAFWRGRDSRPERLALVDIARAHQDLFNASLTNFFFYRDQEAKYGPKVPHESFFKFFKYKYQINVDGTVAAYRLPYLLAGGSLVFKQDSPFYEHFYHQLRPFEHYVPVRRDLSDLVERVRWARDNDEEAQRIARAGQSLARDTLAPHDVICYHAVLLSEWSKRLGSTVAVLDDMTAVLQTSDEGKCVCAEQTTVHGEL